MWAVNILSSNDAMGEATAAHVRERPRRKLTARQAGTMLSEVERR